jgi:hypothetical protein
MPERKWQFIPKYFADRFKEVDVHQVDALPVEIRQKIIHGTDEEAASALNDIRTRERLQKTELLGEAGLELLADMRAMTRSEFSGAV